MNAAVICALIDFTTITGIGPAALDHAVRGMLPEHDEIEAKFILKERGRFSHISDRQNRVCLYELFIHCDLLRKNMWETC